MNINIKTPEKLWKFRRSRAENLVKNCGICSKKEAGEPVSTLLIQEEVNQAKEVQNRGPSYRQFSPRRGYWQRTHPWKKSFRWRFKKNQKNSVTFSCTQWSKQPSMIGHRAMPHHYRITYNELDMVGPIMLGLSNVLLQWQWIKIIIVE